MALTNQHHSIPVCSRPRCSEAANGVTPLAFCAAHYREYNAWLARRELLIEVLSISVESDPELTQKLAALGYLEDERPVEEADVLGALLDQIGQFSADHKALRRADHRQRGVAR